MIKKYKRILLQPLVGQYKLGEYLDNIIIKSNKVASEMYVKGTAFLHRIFHTQDMLDQEKLHFMLLSEKTTDAHIFGLGAIMQDTRIFFLNMTHKNFVKKIKKDFV